MQIDNTEFLKLQESIGKELTCENCDCKFYVMGKRCKASYYRVPLADTTSDMIDSVVFYSPYICRHFWWASSIALNYRESQLSKVFSCKNRNIGCTVNGLEWAPCYQCSNYEEIK